MKWIFEGKVYSSLEELSGRTCYEGNVPEPIITKKEIESLKRYEPICRYGSVEIDDCVFGDFVKWEDLEYLFKNKKVDVGEGAESESEL